MISYLCGCPVLMSDSLKALSDWHQGSVCTFLADGRGEQRRWGNWFQAAQLIWNLLPLQYSDGGCLTSRLTPSHWQHQLTETGLQEIQKAAAECVVARSSGGVSFSTFPKEWSERASKGKITQLLPPVTFTQTAYCCCIPGQLVHVWKLDICIYRMFAWLSSLVYFNWGKL